MKNIDRKSADVNRTVDGDTAEGHRRVLIDEAEEARTALRTQRKVAKRPATLDDEAEGHAVLKSR